LNVAQEWRELPAWIVHLSVQQIGILLAQLQRLYTQRLGAKSEAMVVIRETEHLVENAVSLVLAMPATHIPPMVAAAIFRATTILTHSQAAYDQFMQSRDSFKKAGSLFGEMSKAQREAGYVMPFPTSPMPVLMGRRLDTLVGPIIHLYPRHTGVEKHGEGARVSRFSPAYASVHAGSTNPTTTVATRPAAHDGSRIRLGALFHFITSELTAKGTNTDRCCVACLSLGRRGQDAGGHNFKSCPNLTTAFSAAVARGFHNAAVAH
jgi:hypothetical protein